MLLNRTKKLKITHERSYQAFVQLFEKKKSNLEKVKKQRKCKQAHDTQIERSIFDDQVPQMNRVITLLNHSADSHPNDGTSFA